MQELINNFLNVLPFEFLSYTFMKNALLAILLATPIFAILGTMIVNNKMAFFSDSLGHSAICGIAIRNAIWNNKHKFINDFVCMHFCDSAKFRKT